MPRIAENSQRSPISLILSALRRAQAALARLLLVIRQIQPINLPTLTQKTKMTDLTEYQFREVVATIARNSASYRELLKTDPKSAVETLVQKQLPEDLSFEVVEESSDEITFVIPPARQEEMSEEDLELVAGGVLDLNAAGDIGNVFDFSRNLVQDFSTTNNNFSFLQNIELNQYFINFAPTINVDMSWFGLS